MKQAAGQYLGYSLQAVRMLLHLMDGDFGDHVALEVLGDTSIVSADGRHVIEESKSRTSGSNPIADHAEGLWKTMGTWAEAIRTGCVDAAKTDFRLWIAQPFEGPIAESFSDATDNGSAERAVEAGLDRLAVTKGSTEGLSERIRPHVDRFLAIRPEDRIELIKSFQLEVGTGSAIDEVRNKVRQRFFVDEVVDGIMQSLLGWVNEQVISHIERSEPAIIPFDKYHEYAAAVQRRYNQSGVLSSFAREPTTEETREEIRTRTYVRQLELILDPDEEFADVLEAVVAFLKTQTDQIFWAEKGLVLDSSFKAFEQNLRTAWRRAKKTVEIEKEELEPEGQGYLVYSRCLDHQCTLQNLLVPDHFIPGSFHTLADELEIGWHPQYESRLSRGANDELVRRTSD